MIKEIIKFENIGTPNYLIELSNLINNGSYNKNNIGDFFINRMIDGNTIFDGGLDVLEYIGFIKFSGQNLMYIPNQYQHFLRNNKLLKSKIISMFIDKWMTDDTFNIIFNHDTIFHGVDFSIVIKKSSFKFGKYSKLKQLLIDFDVFGNSYIEDCFVIKPQYKRYFDKSVVKKVQLSLNELRKIQDSKNKHGEDAEIFVLGIEKQKFEGHALIDSIEQVSNINVSAGYDIASLQSTNSTIIDKFIEVKSYSQSPYFYWSKNEIKVAEQEQNNYFLYLVNRDKMNNPDYQPIIIQNPSQNILNNNNWQKDCQSWKFEEISYANN